MKKLGYILISGLLLSAFTGSAREKAGRSGHRSQQSAPRVVGCTPGTAKSDLAINNVRARLYTAGDMWWDFGTGTAEYEIPKGSGKTSLFAGSLWIGGIDAGGQLKVAAMTYRQTGNDFWPGPLSNTATSLAEITSDECRKWDKHFTVTLKEVQDFYNWTQDPSSVPGYAGVPNSILNWPGNGDVGKGQLQFLAPFTDVNGDGSYDPMVGDYPAYDLKDAGCDGKDRIYGDQTLWWVFNDKGDIHTETGAEPLGLEIHAQAFGFITNDEINNMTFYKYKVFNRSSTRLNETYFAMWVDPDLGDYSDDLIGCDVKRGFGFCYNANDKDGTGNTFTYGDNPPAVGIDFFEGPFADPNGADDGITSTESGLGYGNGIPDDERLGMEKFMFYKNDGTLEGNPDNATDFYNYLSGKWKDGQPITYGGSGHNSGGPVSDFMFPWDSDDKNGNVFWEQTAFSDGRMVQSAGTFSLEPGAVNYVTVGAVWARATSGGRKASVALLRQADEKAQKLFDNCFQLLKTPDAPDLDIVELDKELIILIDNKKTSNNANEAFAVVDPLIPAQYIPNNKYVFEGYKVYQVKNADVTATDLNDPAKARLIHQSDVKNGVGRIINYEFDANLGVTIPREMVAGADAGISHSIRVTEDLFALGDKSLVNHKSYHFIAVAYAYNNFKPYAQDVTPDPSCPTCADVTGQKLPYLGSSKNIFVATGIPHIPAPQNGGTIARSKFGDGVKMNRIEGQGNGGNFLEFGEKVHTEVFATTEWLSERPEYERGLGPVKIKVVDPLSVPDAVFEFKMIDTNSAIGYVPLSKANWTLTNKTSGQTITSNRTIDFANEQVIASWGLSVSLTQVPEVFCTENDQNLLDATVTFKDPTKPWVVGLPDEDGLGATNWIRSGVSNTDPKDYDEVTTCNPTGAKVFIDPQQKFETMLTGWAPYRLTSYDADGPAWNNLPGLSQNKMANLASVDIVFTPDQTKWSRCVVFETGNEALLSENGASKLNLRRHPSVDKDGNPDGTGNSFSWFPGYAINVETGERLNIAFGESSWLVGENGADMMWNPTDKETDPLNTMQLWGGKHYIYVFGHNGDARFDSIRPSGTQSINVAPVMATGQTSSTLEGKLRQIPKYDSCRTIYSLMNFYETMASPQVNLKRAVFADAMWVGILGVNSQFGFKNPKDMATDMTVRIRMAKPYKPWSNGPEVGRGGSLETGATYIVKAGPIRHNNKVYNPGQAFIARNSSMSAGYNFQTWWSVTKTEENNGLPYYSFDSKDIAADTADADALKNALALINVVPNPYYAYSAYESSNTENLVKFTNLPQKCEIKIYTSNGTLIRSLSKDDPKTSMDWDIKNHVGIPIASGVYIVHVKVEGVGERILKWFGIIRPTDLEVY